MPLRQILRNRGTEKDIRDYLQSHGFQGPSARFDYLELEAIQRPGWVQVFKFSLSVRDIEGRWRPLLGVARDDERTGIEVFLTESEEEVGRAFDEWSAGLITLHRQRSKLTPLFLTIFGLILFIAAAGAWLSN